MTLCARIGTGTRADTDKRGGLDPRYEKPPLQARCEKRGASGTIRKAEGGGGGLLSRRGGGTLYEGEVATPKQHPPPHVSASVVVRTVLTVVYGDGS